MIQHNFFQKMLLAMLAGFFAACFIQAYRLIIVDAERSLNAGYQNRYSISAD